MFSRTAVPERIVDIAKAKKQQMPQKLADEILMAVLRDDKEHMSFSFKFAYWLRVSCPWFFHLMMSERAKKMLEFENSSNIRRYWKQQWTRETSTKSANTMYLKKFPFSLCTILDRRFIPPVVIVVIDFKMKRKRTGKNTYFNIYDTYENGNQCNVLTT